jgi:hypothetical protein
MADSRPEKIFIQPAITTPCRLVSPDRMHQRNAIWHQKSRDACKIAVEMTLANMLKHPGRYDAIKNAALMPVIAKLKLKMLPVLILLCLLALIGLLIFREGYARYRNIGLHLIKRGGKAAPSTANIKNRMPGL